MTTDPLREALVSLARKLQPSGIQLIVGGGYGLLLRAQLIARTGRTPRYGLTPQFRSTSDLDCFLSTAIITDAAKMKRIAEALGDLGYSPVERYWMFKRDIHIEGRPWTIKIDLLAADVPPDQEHLVRIRDGRRVRPHGFGTLHARRTPEAVTIEQGVSSIDIGDGQNAAVVFVPHSISFILMKLFAFRDRLQSKDSVDREDAPYHAFDILMILATMDADEWDQAGQILSDLRAAHVVKDAATIVAQLFGRPDSAGMVAVVEYARDRQGVRIDPAVRSAVAADLASLFPSPAE